MEFTPRLSMTDPSDINAGDSVYNNPYYVSNNGLIRNHNVNTYQCTYYAIARSGEIAGEPVTTYLLYPSTPEHRIFDRTGFGNGKEWINDTRWETGNVPKVGAIVCYGAGFPGDGGNGHLQIVEEVVDDNLFYISENSGCFGRTPFLRPIRMDLINPTFQGFIYNPYIEEKKKSDWEIALEVIQGLWGTGYDRKNRLEAKGYNYRDIQRIVNKILFVVKSNENRHG